MKYLYKTPEIKVEELAKVDVLCASSEAVGNDNAIKSFDDTVGKQIFDLANFM